jgi:hypothetical protein
MTTPISATTLVEQSLAAIAEHGARTNAFTLVDEAGARAAAHAVDDERRIGGAVEPAPERALRVLHDLLEVVEYHQAAAPPGDGMAELHGRAAARLSSGDRR